MPARIYLSSFIEISDETLREPHEELVQRVLSEFNRLLMKMSHPDFFVEEIIPRLAEERRRAFAELEGQDSEPGV